MQIDNGEPHMENNNTNNVFTYTYSGSLNSEVKEIREKYLPKDADKLDRLRKLDASVTAKATLLATVLGVISAIIFGIGLCCVLEFDSFFLLGIVIGTLGLFGVSLTYPLFLHVLKKERLRITPEILRLSDELIGTK